MSTKRGPDLVATSLSYDSASGNFTSVVKNQGKTAVPAGFTIGVAYLVDGVKCTFGFVAGPLAVGASATIDSEGGACTIAAGTHKITVFVDDVNRISEAKKYNNLFSQTITIGASACSTTPTGTNPIFNPNDPASNGYELVFDSEFNDKNDIDQSCTSPPSNAGCTDNQANKNWYLNSWTFPATVTNPATDLAIETPPYSSAKATVLHIKQSQVNGNWALSTMGPSAGMSKGPAAWQQGWNGKAFGGGWYTEARFSTEYQSCTGGGGPGPSCVATGTVVQAPPVDNGHASIWSYAVDHFTGDQVFSENDLMDGIKGNNVNPSAFYLANAIAWNGNGGTVGTLKSGCIDVNNLINITDVACAGQPANFQDRTHAHTWGQLWIPATPTVQGYTQQFFDGVPMAKFLWDKFVPGQTTNPGVIDVDHMQVNIGNDPRHAEDATASTSTSWWDWVHVWQLPAAATASGNAVVTPQHGFTGGNGACFSTPVP